MHWEKSLNEFGLIIQGEYIDSSIICTAILSAVGGTINQTYLTLFDTSLEDVLFHLNIAVALHDRQKENTVNTKMQELGISLSDFDLDG